MPGGVVTFTINLEVMSWVGAPQDETLRGWLERQRRDIALVKISGSNAIKPLNKKGNITSTS